MDRKFVGREFFGCALWCWVAAAGFNDDGETEMRDRYER